MRIESRQSDGGNQVIEQASGKSRELSWPESGVGQARRIERQGSAAEQSRHRLWEG